MAIRKQRQAKHLSQEALAFESSLHRTYIGSVERGERNLSIDNIVRISLALAVAPSELLRQAGL